MSPGTSGIPGPVRHECVGEPKDRPMTTVVDLPEDQIAELKELTKQSDAAAAIRAAMAEYLRYVRRMRLKDLSGRVQMQENWPELEKGETEAGERDPGPGPD